MSTRFSIVSALLLTLAQASASAAEDRSPPFPDAEAQEQWKRAEELARKGMQELLQSLELFKDALPDYGVPYVDKNGNIIIPRKKRTAPPAEPSFPEPQRDRT